MDTASSSRRTGDHRGDRNFSIERRRDADGTIRLILRGELDVTARGDLREALVAAQRAGTAVVVVLDQLDYLDSAGIGELLEGCERASRRGHSFAVTHGTENVHRVLWISGVLSRLCGATEHRAEREATDPCGQRGRYRTAG